MPLIVKKVLRSMWRSKMAYLACVTVITVGIMCYVVLSAVVVRLGTAKDAFYEDYNFADVFARVTQAPIGILDDIKDVAGVRKAEGRLSASARVITDDKDKIVTLRVYGVDTQTGMKEQINGFKLLGQPLGDSKDILLDEQFLNARGLNEGDLFEVSISGSRTVFTVRGAFNSPEYVFKMSDSGSMMPEPDSFGIAVVSAETLENITGQGGIITDIGIVLDDGFEFADVKSRLSEILDGAGTVYLLPRKDQPSNQMLTMELTQVGNMASFMSGIFLLVAAAILYIMLRRLVEQERTQIGVLKAFGYSNSDIIANYMLYGALTGIIGGILGALLGAASTESMYNLYLVYFSIPRAEVPISSGVLAYVLRGVLVSAGAGIAAAFLGVLGALKLRPAEAMRPPAPPLINGSIFENNRFFDAVFTKRGLMTLRYIERNKFKSALIVFSVSLAYMLMTMMYSYSFLMDKMMIDQFAKIETYDMKVTLKTPVLKSHALAGISGLPGVNYAETVLELPFTLNFENISKGVSIIGLNGNSPVYKIMDTNGVFHTPPIDGILISKKTAKELGASAGSLVTLESPYLREKTEIRISGVIDASIGASAYMDCDSLSLLLEMPPISNMVVLTTGDGKCGDIKEALINASNVTDISDKEAILKTYNDMLDSYAFMIYAILAMAILIAFAIIYNISGVSLSERSRELATMRVLGYEAGETSEILSFENYLLCIMAIIVGIPLTMMLMKVYGTAFESDMFSFPTYLPPISHLYSGLSCLLAVFLSNAASLASVKKFELAVVLKERE